MNPVVYYHDNCADGYGALYAVQLHEGIPVDAVPVSYGEDSLVKALEATPGGVEGRTVYVVDFSFSLEDMRFLLRKAEQVYWFDHHTSSRATAMQLLNCDLDPGGRLLGETDSLFLVHDESRSGAMITWQELHPRREVPVLYSHLDDHDRWQFRWPATKAYMRSLFAMKPWDTRLFGRLARHYPFPDQNIGDRYDDYIRFVNYGEGILHAHVQNVASLVEDAARPCVLKGSIHAAAKADPNHPSNWGNGSWKEPEGLAANCPVHMTSDVGHSLARRSKTFGLLWRVTADGEYACSLRSEGDYDVAKIAKLFGGGGHKNAAGFKATREQLIEWGCL